jgi:hypothetical protein
MYVLLAHEMDLHKFCTLVRGKLKVYTSANRHSALFYRRACKIEAIL